MKYLIFLLLVAATPAQLAAQELSLRWKFQTNGMIVGSPVADGNLIYVGSTDSNLYAIDMTTGKERWHVATGGAIRSDALITGRAVYVFSDNGRLHKLDKQTGKRLWNFTCTPEKQVDRWDYYLSSPVLFGARIIFGHGNGSVYALDTLTGLQVWSYKTGDAVHASPVVAGQTVYAGSFDGFLYALNGQSGNLLWKFKTVGDRYFPEGAIQKAVTVCQDAVVFGSRDFNIYALDIQKGTGLWNWKEKGSWIIASPLFWKNHLYFGTSDSHRFYCVEAGSGEVKWNISLPMRVYGSAAVMDSVIWFGCFDGKLYGVHTNTGKLAYSFQTDGSKKNYASVFDGSGHFRKGFILYGPDIDETEKAILGLGAILGTPLVSGKQIYFGSTDGGLYALSLKPSRDKQ